MFPEEFVRLESERGQSLRIYTDPGRLREELLAKAPGDAWEIRRWIRAIERFGKFRMPDFTASRLQRMRDDLHLLPYVPALWRFSQMTAEEYGRRFKHPLLRGFFGEIDMGQLSCHSLHRQLARQHGRLAAHAGSGLQTPGQHAPGLDRFVMAGQWVLPGGGLPSGLITARFAIRSVCERDQVPFQPQAHQLAAAGR